MESQRAAVATEATQMKEKWVQATERLESMNTEMKLITERCDFTSNLVGEICTRNKLLLDLTVARLRGSEENVIRLTQEVGGVQQIVADQASKIAALESKLKQTEIELEREKKDLTLTRECLAGVSFLRSFPLVML